MKVPLPSSGILGIQQVELRAPTFRDIRALNQANQEEHLLQASFVKSLLPGNIDLSKITKMDLDYLFVIAAFSTQLDRVSFEAQCPCGRPIKDNLLLEDLEVEDLKKYSLPYNHILNDVEYSYTLLSAADHIAACEYALNQEVYQDAYEDFCVSRILNLSLSEVDLLPVQAYASAMLFQQANFHGVNPIKSVICPACGKVINIHVGISSQIVRMDLTTLMEAYDGIKDNVDFQSFLDFTSAEYKAYINVLEVSQ